MLRRVSARPAHLLWHSFVIIPCVLSSYYIKGFHHKNYPEKLYTSINPLTHAQYMEGWNDTGRKGRMPQLQRGSSCQKDLPEMSDDNSWLYLFKHIRVLSGLQERNRQFRRICSKRMSLLRTPFCKNWRILGLDSSPPMWLNRLADYLVWRGATRLLFEPLAYP